MPLYSCFLFQWSVKESAPGLNRPDKLTLGLLVDGEFSCSVLDKGPSADSQEVNYLI